MPTSSSDKKQLRAIGHNLKPIVIVAQKGLTESVKVEIERALSEHELIKIKLLTSTKREDKKAIIKLICDELNAESIQSIGHMGLFYRAAREPDPKLSNVIRFKK